MSELLAPDRRLITFARAMRHTPAPAESRLWTCVRSHRLAGFRFRRQHPIPPYIADFYCAAARLVIEMDGESHAFRAEYDRVREAHFVGTGLTVLRFLNPQVFDERDWVVETIYAACVAGCAANETVRHKLGADGRFRRRGVSDEGTD